MKHAMIIIMIVVGLCTPLAAMDKKPTVLIIASYHNKYA